MNFSFQLICCITYICRQINSIVHTEQTENKFPEYNETQVCFTLIQIFSSFLNLGRRVVETDSEEKKKQTIRFL
jgi:hypothetical protein